jgi:hypothetical protein
VKSPKLMPTGKGYDSDGAGVTLLMRGIPPNVPPKANPIKQFGRIATRNNKAKSFMGFPNPQRAS